MSSFQIEEYLGRLDAMRVITTTLRQKVRQRKFTGGIRAYQTVLTIMAALGESIENAIYFTESDLREQKDHGLRSGNVETSIRILAVADTFATSLERLLESGPCPRPENAADFMVWSVARTLQDLLKSTIIFAQEQIITTDEETL